MADGFTLDALEDGNVHWHGAENASEVCKKVMTEWADLVQKRQEVSKNWQNSIRFGVRSGCSQWENLLKKYRDTDAAWMPENELSPPQSSHASVAAQFIARLTATQLLQDAR